MVRARGCERLGTGPAAHARGRVSRRLRSGLSPLSARVASRPPACAALHASTTLLAFPVPTRSIAHQLTESEQTLFDDREN
ncbi:unnamed protein product [Parnassius apollo]|uniref:(apollo) hypothetical protein n=1 Tax=Parnassius apollo TaxID=110799 RepID=A0A8S3XCH7_PARAO|nr:unnamed protein product [Parnassius apollo]